MVDGSGLLTRPESSTSGTRNLSWDTTSSALRAPLRPERFALVPVSAHPACRAKQRTSGEAGWRTATVREPAVTKDGTRELAGNTIVRGPGQKARANGANSGGKWRTSRASWASESTSNKIGLLSGRPLERKTRRSAASLEASASNP